LLWVSIKACGFAIIQFTCSQTYIFSLQKILSPGDGLTPSCRKAEYHFCVKQDVQICSMVTAEKFLLIGMVGEITGWDWKTITTSKNPKLAFNIQIPTAK